MESAAELIQIGHSSHNNGVCRPGGQQWKYYHGALSEGPVKSSHNNLRSRISSKGVRSSTELQGLDKNEKVLRLWLQQWPPGDKPYHISNQSLQSRVILSIVM